MREMTLEHMAEACQGQLIYPAREPYANGRNRSDYEGLCIAGVVTDNRQVERDYLFIPFVGEKVDAHRFIPQAFAQGAAAVISERLLEDVGGPYILVQSSLAALQDLAAYYRRQMPIPLVGVIGSVGKTSTKEMIASVLSQRYRVLKTEGNFNNEIGMPMTILGLREEHQLAVVEMGIDNFGQMSLLASISRPDIVVITNIGQAHLEFMKTREGILAAKTEVFDYLPAGATVILNGDDDHLSCIRKASDAKIIFFGMGKDASVSMRAKDAARNALLNEEIKEQLKQSALRDGLKEGCFELSQREGVQERLARETYRAKNLRSLGLEGIEAGFSTPEGDFTARIPMPGEHNVYNALAAAAVGQCLGLSQEEIIRGMEGISTIQGRAHFIHLENLTLIDDCYNANPASMRASLQILSQASGRKIAVLGDMGELGEDAVSMHYGIGQAVLDAGVDLLLTAGTLAREIARASRQANSGIEVLDFSDKQELLPVLLDRIQKGDTLLVKASHFMGFADLVSAIEKKFNESSSAK